MATSVVFDLVAVLRVLVVIRFSLKPNTHRRRQRDVTRQFRLVGVGGVYGPKALSLLNRSQ